mgnify:CR=1 FL=1
MKKPLLVIAMVSSLLVIPFGLVSIAAETAVEINDFGEDEMRTYEGTIAWISSKAEFTPKTIATRDERANMVYAIKINIKNDGFLKIGMYGNVNF